MKTCFKCRRELPLDEYYRHSQMGDGHLNKCKQCTRSDVRRHRADNLERVRLYDRLRNKTDDRKIKHRLKNKAKRKKMGPDYDRAHNAVSRAVRKGSLIRPTVCQRCPATGDIEAHHDDYSRVLDVMWLCPVCHAARHRELGRLSRLAAAYGDQPDPFPHITAVRDSEPGHRSDATGTNLSGAAPETATTSKESA